MQVSADQALLMAVKYFMHPFVAVTEENGNCATSTRPAIIISVILMFTLWGPHLFPALRAMINASLHSPSFSKWNAHPETSQKPGWCAESPRSLSEHCSPGCLPALGTGHCTEGARPRLSPEKEKARCPSNKGLPKLLSAETWATSLLATQ